jgi:hypothetical protein
MYLLLIGVCISSTTTYLLFSILSLQVRHIYLLLIAYACRRRRLVYYVTLNLHIFSHFSHYIARLLYMYLLLIAYACRRRRHTYYFPSSHYIVRLSYILITDRLCMSSSTTCLLCDSKSAHLFPSSHYIARLLYMYLLLIAYACRRRRHTYYFPSSHYKCVCHKYLLLI